MSDHFKTFGRALMANGYLVVPIRKGEKRPAISQWQKSRLTPADLDRYPDHGVGVLCGQGANPIVGVDIDVSHPVVGPAIIAWCRDNLGETCERIGAAPRILLVYRADKAGIAKGASQQFFDPNDPLKPSGKKNIQQVEILGLGQQFVAYHEHPDTASDYIWPDLMDGIANVRAEMLPVVSERSIVALLAEVNRLVRSTSGVDLVGSAEAPTYNSNNDADDLASLSSKVGTPIAEMTALLGFLENEDDDYATWLNVGAALHHEYGDTEYAGAAVDLWRSYGRRSSKDKPGEYDYKWRSFGRHGGAPTTLRWLLKVCHQAKRENEHNDKRQRIDKIREIIREQKDSLKLGGTDVVRQIKELMPDDPLVKTEVLGAFQSQYKLLTGTSMPIAQARALLVGPRAATVHAKRPLTEFGNAERMLDQFGSGMMYVPETDDWYLWTGVYWRKAVPVEIEHMAKETIRALVNEREEHEDAAEFFQFCAISQQARMVKNMVTLAKSDPRVVVPARELDRSSHLLGVQNGVVDLTTGQLLPPDPDHHITLVAGCDYNPTAKCPLFERTVQEVFSGDEDMASYFKLTLGYALTGNPKEDVMFIPFGNGANGKSTVLGVVRRTFGSYARSAEASSFVKDGPGAGNAGGAREDLVRLRGARFVYVNEPDENGELREGAVKSMTGGDAITARGVFAKSSVEVVPSWVVYMPTNHKPIVKGGDNGIWRRLVLLPFERNFEADPTVAKDPEREEKLLKEMPGVLALLVRCAIAYQRGGLAQPAGVRAARDNYRTQMDLLAEWLDECCELGIDREADSSELWASWEKFAKDRGILNYVRSSVVLGRRLEPRFPAFKTTGGRRRRRGISLKDIFAPETEDENRPEKLQ